MSETTSIFFDVIIGACGVGVAATVYWWVRISREAKRKREQDQTTSPSSSSQLHQNFPAGVSHLQ